MIDRFNSSVDRWDDALLAITARMNDITSDWATNVSEIESCASKMERAMLNNNVGVDALTQASDTIATKFTSFVLSSAMQACVAMYGKYMFLIFNWKLQPGNI